MTAAGSAEKLDEDFLATIGRARGTRVSDAEVVAQLTELCTRFPVDPLLLRPQWPSMRRRRPSPPSNGWAGRSSRRSARCPPHNLNRCSRRRLSRPRRRPPCNRTQPPGEEHGHVSTARPHSSPEGPVVRAGPTRCGWRRRGPTSSWSTSSANSTPSSTRCPRQRISRRPRSRYVSTAGSSSASSATCATRSRSTPRSRRPKKVRAHRPGVRKRRDPAIDGPARPPDERMARHDRHQPLRRLLHPARGHPGHGRARARRRVVITGSTSSSGVSPTRPRCSTRAHGLRGGEAGVLALMRNYAMALGKHGIRVNTIIPAGVNTPMIANEFFTNDLQADALPAGWPTSWSTGRSSPRDISDGVLYLLSERPSTSPARPCRSTWARCSSDPGLASEL